MTFSRERDLLQPALRLLIEQVNAILKNKNQGPGVFKDIEFLPRVNIIGIVASLERLSSISNILIDDSTAIINVKLFEEKNIIKKIKIGATVMFIGKIREYNQQFYLAPEIIKLVNPLWLKLRLLSLIKNNLVPPPLKRENSSPKIELMLTPALDQQKYPKKEMQFLQNEQKIPQEKLIDLIKNLDQGEGVLIEEIISMSPLPNTEKIVEKMLERGDLFQCLPGRIKVL